MKTIHPTLHSRLYAGPTDLTALLALSPVCRPAAWQTGFLRVANGVQAELVTFAEPRT